MFLIKRNSNASSIILLPYNVMKELRYEFYFSKEFFLYLKLQRNLKPLRQRNVSYFKNGKIYFQLFHLCITTVKPELTTTCIPFCSPNPSVYNNDHLYINNGQTFGVPRIVVVNKLDCVFQQDVWKLNYIELKCN